MKKYLVIKRGPGGDLWFETNDLERAQEWAEQNGTEEIYER